IHCHQLRSIVIIATYTSTMNVCNVQCGDRSRFGVPSARMCVSYTFLPVGKRGVLMSNNLSRRQLAKIAGSLPLSYGMLAGMNAMGAVSVSAQGNELERVNLGVGSDPLTLIPNDIV